MISLAIGLLIINLLMETYLASQKSLKLETALNNIQNNAQSAISILTNEIHQSGHIGCAKLSPDFPIISLPDYELNSENKIVINNKNELIIRYAKYENAYLTEAMKRKNRIYFKGDNNISSKDILLISDCKSAEIFTARNIKKINDSYEVTLTSPLHHRYDKYAEISRLIINKFYVAKTNRKYPDGKSVYGLYMDNIHHQKMEVVSGISAMHINLMENKSGVAIDFDMESPQIRKKWHMFAELK